MTETEDTWKAKRRAQLEEELKKAKKDPGRTVRGMIKDYLEEPDLMTEYSDEAKEVEKHLKVSSQPLIDAEGSFKNMDGIVVREGGIYKGLTLLFPFNRPHKK